VSKPASELQGEMFPLGAAAAKATREFDIGRGIHGRPWCSLCRTDTAAIDEWYMVEDELWLAAIGGDRFIRFLCIGCLEVRLGRRLLPTDFPSDVPINQMHRASSPRLRDRMTRGREAQRSTRSSFSPQRRRCRERC
jgi:hypothetical protein